MTLPTNLADAIVHSVQTVQSADVLQPVQMGCPGWQNELLLFMKPELFLVDDPQSIRRSVELLKQKLGEYGAEVHGVVTLSGSLLQEKQIMDRHYGFINRLSRLASTLLTAQDHQKMAQVLGEDSLAGYDILGGHEYQKKYPTESGQQLADLWFSKKALKVRSGFYIQSYEKNGGKLCLVNGFHPSQLEHFTDPTHRIVLFLLHSNTAWGVLKNELVGATFPEKAVPQSIRGNLFAQAAQFGQKKVDVSCNGVHLSAGPYEAAFELINFFGDLLPAGECTPQVVSQLVQRGLSNEEALFVTRNPQVKLGEKTTDLFTATEDTDTGPALDLWLQNRG